MAMAVPALISAAGSAVASKQKSDAQARHNRGQAELTRFSDVTGRMGKLKTGAPTALGGAIKGGFAGAKFGQDNPGMFSADGGQLTTPNSQGAFSMLGNKKLGNTDFL